MAGTREHSSRTHPPLARAPGTADNWVEQQGGLPAYIERVARHIHSDNPGYTISRAIASAVSQVKKWAAKGNPQAIRAVAQWNAKRASSKARTRTRNLSVPAPWHVVTRADLRGPAPFLPPGVVWDLAISSHGFVPNNPLTALKWRKGSWTPPGGKPITAAEIRSRLGATSNKDAVRIMTSDPAAMNKVLGKKVAKRTVRTSPRKPDPGRWNAGGKEQRGKGRIRRADALEGGDVFEGHDRKRRRVTFRTESTETDPDGRNPRRVLDVRAVDEQGRTTTMRMDPDEMFNVVGQADTGSSPLDQDRPGRRLSGPRGRGGPDTTGPAGPSTPPRPGGDPTRRQTIRSSTVKGRPSTPTTRRQLAEQVAANRPGPQSGPKGPVSPDMGRQTIRSSTVKGTPSTPTTRRTVAGQVAATRPGSGRVRDENGVITDTGWVPISREENERARAALRSARRGEVVQKATKYRPFEVTKRSGKFYVRDTRDSRMTTQGMSKRDAVAIAKADNDRAARAGGPLEDIGNGFQVRKDRDGWQLYRGGESLGAQRKYKTRKAAEDQAAGIPSTDQAVWATAFERSSARSLRARAGQESYRERQARADASAAEDTARRTPQRSAVRNRPPRTQAPTPAAPAPARAAPAPARADVPSRPVRNRPPRRQSPPAAPATAPSANTPAGRRQIREQQRATGDAWNERAKAQRARDETPAPPMTQRRRVVGSALVSLVKRQQVMNSEQRRILNGAVEKFKAGDNEGAVEQLHRVPMHKGHAKKLLDVARRHIETGHRAVDAQERDEKERKREADEAAMAESNAAESAEWAKVRAKMPDGYDRLTTFYEDALGRSLKRKELQAAARFKQFPTITLEQAKAAVERGERRERERQEIQRKIDAGARARKESPEIKSVKRAAEVERTRRAARRTKSTTPLQAAGTLTDEEFAALGGPVLRGTGTPEDPRVRYDSTTWGNGGRWVVEARNKRGQIRRAVLLSDTEGPSDEAERQRISDLGMRNGRDRPRTSRERAVALADEFATIAKKSAEQRRKEQRARARAAKAAEAPGDGGLFPAPRPVRPRKDDRGTPEEFAAGTRITITTPEGPVQGQVWSAADLTGYVFAIDAQGRTWRVGAKGGKGERIDTRAQAEQIAKGREAERQRAEKIRADRLAKYGTTDPERIRRISSRGDAEMTAAERDARTQARGEQAAAAQPKPAPSLDELRAQGEAKRKRDIAAKRAIDPWRPDDAEAIADMRTAIDQGRYEWAEQIAHERIFAGDRVDQVQRAKLERLRARARALHAEQQSREEAEASGDPELIYQTGMRSGARAENDGRPEATIGWLEWMLRLLPADHPKRNKIQSMLNKRKNRGAAA